MPREPPAKEAQEEKAPGRGQGEQPGIMLVPGRRRAEIREPGLDRRVVPLPRDGPDPRPREGEGVAEEGRPPGGPRAVEGLGEEAAADGGVCPVVAGEHRRALARI